jgi:squalene synthase HpnC
MNNINEAYNSALEFARNHYENFPVVSYLIPKYLRKHIAIIYWFARTADDIADEGILSAEDKLNRLNEFEVNFRKMLKAEYKSAYESALHNTIKERELQPEHFTNLLKAFKQDVTKMCYENYGELLDYCRNSANPVGRLILEIYGIKNDEAIIYSDRICTALQITNFLQDVKQDFEKGRIYLPKDEMQKYKVSKIMFEDSEINLNFKQLIEFCVNRTQLLFDEGRNLLKFLKGRLKYEIKWTILGGEAILQKIRKSDYNVLVRPYLTKKDFIILLFKSAK